jgi:D-sedoheptulose 7-phosphate isomerase
MRGSERFAGACDIVVRAPLTAIEQIEDLHVVFAHILMRLLGRT